MITQKSRIAHAVRIRRSIGAIFTSFFMLRLPNKASVSVSQQFDTTYYYRTKVLFYTLILHASISSNHESIEQQHSKRRLAARGKLARNNMLNIKNELSFLTCFQASFGERLCLSSDVS